MAAEITRLCSAYCANRILLSIIGLIAIAAIGLSACDSQRPEVGAPVVRNNQYNPIDTAQALNYCMVSLTRIVNSNDRVVLQTEYSNILNNINLQAIQDREVKESMESLLDAAHKSLLTVNEEAHVEARYQRKLDRAWRDTLVNAAESITPSLNVYALVSNAVVNVGTAYFEHERQVEEYEDELDEKKWQLDKDTGEEMHRLRKELFGRSWELTRKYNLPERWRLTEDQVNSFVANVGVAEKDPSRGVRLLEYIQDDFVAFPPFWLAIGKAYEANHEPAKALKAYARYEQAGWNILRKDPNYAELCMHRVGLLDISHDRQQILRDLSAIHKAAPKDAAANVFVAMKYAQMGLWEQAERQLQYNIDEQLAIPLSFTYLGDRYIQQRRESDVDSLIEELENQGQIPPLELVSLALRGQSPVAMKAASAFIRAVKIVEGHSDAKIPYLGVITINTIYFGLIDLPMRGYIVDDIEVQDLFQDSFSSRKGFIESNGESAAQPERKESEGIVTYFLGVPFVWHVSHCDPVAGYRIQLKHGPTLVTIVYNKNSTKREVVVGNIVSEWRNDELTPAVK